MRAERVSRIRFALVCGLALGGLVWALGSAFLSIEPHARDYEFGRDSKWIRVKDETQRTGCFRKDFFLDAKVRHAWMAVACEGGFELVCNSDPVGAMTLWRATRPFQNGITEAGQRAVTTEPAVAYNFPREYQWTTHANHRVPVLFDLRPFLNPGENALCVETYGRWTGVAFRLVGEIELENGKVIRLTSDESWKGEPVPKGMGQREWVEVEAPVDDWESAVAGRRFSGGQVTFVPSGLFEKKFEGEWMIGEALAKGSEGTSGQDFVFEWEQDDPVEDAWVRVASRGAYMLYLNGQPVQPPSRAKRGLGDGGWMISWKGRRPLEVYPTLVDPDETASALVGYRFEDPKHGDPTENNFKRFENNLNRTRERAAATKPGEELDDKYAEKEAKASLPDPYGILEEAERRVPPAVIRERGKEQLQGYGIGPVIKKGRNELRVRLLAEPQMGYQRSQPVAIAVDGEVRGTNGVRKEIRSNAEWRSEWRGRELKLLTNDNIARPGTNFPQLKYIGEARRVLSWKKVAFFVSLVTAVVLFFLGVRSRIWEQAATGFLVTVVLSIFVKFAMFERSESLWFRSELWPWFVVLAGVLGAAVMVFWSEKSWQRTFRIPSWVILGVLLLLCLFLRGYRVVEQPIDDDEYASIQAVVSIAETGVPEIGQGIWYSRSPGYHYLAGFFAWLFGANLWVLRMVTVVTSVITGWVVWRMCLTYFHSRWVAAAATFFFAVHPFLIFTGHIARFYQQQQLFILLLVDFFMRGFVIGKSAQWRVWAVFCFGFAVISQEISIAFVPILVVLYVLFGKDVNWRWEVKTVIACCLAAAVVAADILLFQLKCMTRPVGISPNVEATISPNFWELGNLTSMFISYSRLHVVLSVFWLVSLIWSLKVGNRRLIALHVSLLAAVLFFNLLITSVSFRYQYTVVAIWLMLGCHGLWVLFELIGRWTGNKGGAVVLRNVAALAVLISWSPWRIFGSYEEKILGDPISGLRYVNANWREGDKIMITEPHPHAAKMEVGQADYDLVVPILYDFTYSDEGLLRDRNGDAIAVNKVAQLQEIFATDERVWILINREKFRSVKKNIRWEYPTAREEFFIRENCRLVYRSYLWHVYLWDRNLAKYHAFRGEPYSWSE